MIGWPETHPVGWVVSASTRLMPRIPQSWSGWLSTLDSLFELVLGVADSSQSPVSEKLVGVTPGASR